MSPSYIISPVAAFVLSIILIPIIRKIAIRINLVDKPNFRKVHVEPIPLVGGISVFISTTLTLLFAIAFENEAFTFKNIFFATVIMLFMGVIDDRFDLRASLKLAIQLILAHFIYMQGIKIESLYGLFGIYELTDSYQYFLTILITAGVVNAFNLMDGIDGLAAGIGILGFIIFTYISFVLGQTIMTLIFLTFVGSLFAFLYFNFNKRKKIFMGDAGSLMIGFILVVSGIWLLQSAQNSEHKNLTALGVITVLIVPVLDAIRVFRRRAKSGKSPFAADRTHLHHLILNIGLKHKFATLSILFIVTVIMVFGYLGFSYLGLTFSIVLMLFIYNFITSFLQFNNKLNYWKEQIKAMEHKM